jgi:hypothetical protein
LIPVFFLPVLTAWSDLLGPIESMVNDMIGNPLIIGAVIFLWITFIALLMFIPFEAMIVIWVPLTFLVGYWIPSLRIILGIMLGILIGLGLIKWIRR